MQFPNTQPVINNWVHYMCMDNMEAGSVKAQISFANGVVVKQEEFGSHFERAYGEISVRTTLGNSLDGGEPFVGFMREFRLYSSANEVEIKALMNQHLSLTDTSGLNLYGSFSQGWGSAKLDLEHKERMNTNFVSSGQTPPFTWEIDSDLVICPPDTVYENGCCHTFDLEGYIEEFTEEGGSTSIKKAKFRAVLTNSKGQGDTLNQYSWTMYKVADNIKTKLEFQANNGKEIEIAYSELNTNAIYEV